MVPLFHFFSSSVQRKYNNLNKAFSFGKAPFFVTLRKLELIDSIAVSYTHLKWVGGRIMPEDAANISGIQEIYWLSLIHI